MSDEPVWPDESNRPQSGTHSANDGWWFQNKGGRCSRKYARSPLWCHVNEGKRQTATYLDGDRSPCGVDRAGGGGRRKHPVDNSCRRVARLCRNGTGACCRTGDIVHRQHMYARERCGDESKHTQRDKWRDESEFHRCLTARVLAAS